MPSGALKKGEKDAADAPRPSATQIAQGVLDVLVKHDVAWPENAPDLTLYFPIE